MRDPRLAEIEFLMDLDRNEEATEIPAGREEQGRLLEESTADWYGLGLFRFQDMVLDLVISGLVVGLWGPLENGMLVRYDIKHASDCEKVTRELLHGGSLFVRISHAGRVHLWNQRDALLRDPDLEPFGLRSRAAWDRDLFLRLQWATPKSPLSILFLDLDNFGRVNKEWGHPVGDAVLRLVFGLVRSVVGTRGAAYRYGGEEVGVLLPSVDRETAAGIAEELRTLIERDVHVQVSALGAPQTATIGVAELTGPMANDDAVTRAEEPVRRTKLAHKKNRVVLEDGAGAATGVAAPAEDGHSQTPPQ